MIFLALLLAAAPSTGTVTLPLDEARSLLTTAQEPQAPLSAAVIGQHLSGQVTGESLQVTANFTITVLDGARWSRLALVKLEPGVTLLDASLEDGMLVTAQQSDVVFVSRRPGTYQVELKLSVRGVGSPRHAATLTRGPDAREGVMHVETAEPDQTLEQGADVVSTGGQWTVEWKGRTHALVAAVRPPMEPVVTGSTVQIVSTVEGRARMLVQYRLGLDREQAFGLRLPPEWTLTRVSCNGAPREVPVGREVSIAVAPRTAGAREGTVDLTLERDFGVFHLSGRLSLALPGVSWPTSVVEASVHLPNVFEYRRLGGSLEPADTSEPSPSSSLPGRALQYRQHLVASAGPTLELSYSVDLTNRYFRVRR